MTPAHWPKPKQRRDYVAAAVYCEYRAINGCRKPATDAEHYLGRGLFPSDDPRALLALCRECHREIGRGHEAAVNGLWIKMRSCESEASHDLHGAYFGPLRDERIEWLTRSYFEWLEDLGFRVEVLRNWIDDGTMSDAAVRRAVDVLQANGE